MAQLQPGDPGFDWSKYAEFRKGNDPLAEAQAFLADPRRSMAPVPTSSDIESAKRNTTVAQEPMSLRGLTDIGENAALPLGLAGMVPSPLSPVLLGSSAALAGLGGLRKLINPQADESRIGGAVQAGLSALPALSGAARGIRNAGQLAMKRIPISAEKAYRGVGSLEQLSGLNEAPQSIQALENLVSKAKSLPEDVLSKFPESWRQFASAETPKVTSSVKTTRTPAEMLAKMNQESAAGYRNVPSHESPRLDVFPRGGLDTITPDEWKKLGLRQVHQSTPTYLSEQANWGSDLLGPEADRAARLSIPARARAFRTNTPFTE